MSRSTHCQVSPGRSLSGVVYLVGAGPGDPGLMTRRALELIARADVILYDRLIPASALDGAQPDAELRYVGKSPGADSVPQEEINALLVEHGRTGATVVRLKGGDPFVFGRGGEEAEALAAAGRRFRGRPGGHRRDRGARLRRHPGDTPRRGVRGRLRHRARGPGEGGERDRLARARRIPGHARAVHGRAPPAGDRRAADRGGAARRRAGGRRRARHAARAADGDRAARPRSPTPRRTWGRPPVTLVGPVARLREGLAWIERRPLHGRSVVVTRARAQASGLAATLRGLGAEVVEAPAIRIVPRPVEAELRDAGLRPRLPHEPERRRACFRRARRAGLTRARSPARRVAAIGPGTAREL